MSKNITHRQTQRRTHKRTKIPKQLLIAAKSDNNIPNNNNNTIYVRYLLIVPISRFYGGFVLPVRQNTPIPGILWEFSTCGSFSMLDFAETRPPTPSCVRGGFLPKCQFYLREAATTVSVF